MIFVDLIIPLPLPNLFTYFVPEEFEKEVKVGARVVVQFGRTKMYTGLIKNIHENAPKKYNAKSIEYILDEDPIVTKNQLSTWDWIAEYYICTLGEVMQMALPSGFKLVSETKVILADDNIEFDNLSDKEYLVVEALQIQPILSLAEINDVLGVSNIHHIIKSLLEKSIVFIEEEVQQKYKPKTDAYLSLNYQKYTNEDEIELAFTKVKNAPKQEDAIIRLITHKNFNYTDFKVKRQSFCKAFNLSSAIIKSLIEKDIFIEEQITSDRLEKFIGKTEELPQLNDFQNNALTEINEGFSDHKPVLLHGVTGSGKTEIYLHLIQKMLEDGKEVLYLLPEIALTAQLINRLQKVFGEKVGVYHSKFNLNERIEIWNDLLNPNGKYKIIIGARSSLFLPFHQLGLIVVDEEHENTFKQFDPAPRYHARDAAVYMAHKFKSNIILGSATPSVESFYNCHSNKYKLVNLNKRFGGIAMPEIFCADVQEEKKKKLMKGLFSDFLVKEIEQALENNEQVILFQNRRGYAPLLECTVCGHVEKCMRCDVSLTYHKHSNLLRCHYCGYMQNVAVTCSACGSVETNFKGSGTEQIQEEFAKLFPNTKLARLDLDTTKRKYAYQEIISEFEDREIDVLIGTQMLTKGLDFDGVSVVGILNADTMLNFPDFRAFERAFQLMLQVAGRAGRRDKRGKVIIQTYNPHHAIIRNVIDYDYLSMYNSEILNRKNFYYPPFYRLIEITFKHANKNVLDAASDGVSTGIKNSLGKAAMVLGPEYPPISRINNLYLKKTMIKIDKGFAIKEVKLVVQNWVNKFKNDPSFRKVRMNINVDPQ